MWNLDLSEVDGSILLSVEFKLSSYTAWAADLKENHLHAILSGFAVGDTPGTDTFYDFQKRLWLSDEKNLSNPIHPPKVKPQKPDKKGEKAPPTEKVTVKELFARFELDALHDMEPYRRLYEIFKVLFLGHSVQEGLVNLMELSLAGDGTPVYTAAQERKNAPVTVWKKVTATVSVTAFTASLTVTSARTPTVTATTSAMTST